MNRIFKVLWNAATGTFVVTSETAKAAAKNGRRKLAVSALIGLSSIMVSADALANAGNDTGDGVTPTGTQTGGKGWIAIGTDATANTYTNVDGASAAMGYKARDGEMEYRHWFLQPVHRRLFVSAWRKIGFSR